MIGKKGIRIAYFVSFIVVIASIVTRILTNGNEDLAETFGDVLKYLFLVEYAFIIVMIVIRSKQIKIPLLTKNMKSLMSMHRLIGIACIAILSLHVALIFEVGEMWEGHYIEGYVIIALMAIAILGIKNKETLKKNSLNIHMAFALLSFIPFVLHV